MKEKNGMPLNLSHISKKIHLINIFLFVFKSIVMNEAHHPKKMCLAMYKEQGFYSFAYVIDLVI